MAAVAIVGAGPGVGASIARRFAREQLAVGLSLTFPVDAGRCARHAANERLGRCLHR